MTASDDSVAAAFHDFEHAGWEQAGEKYLRTFFGVTDQATGPLLDAAGVVGGSRVLDVATGPGNVAAAAAARGAAVTGIDFSAAQVALARKLNPGIEFEEGNAENIRFADGSFDAVVMNFGLLHFPDPERALAEACRVLASGGRLAFTVWAPPERAPPFAILMGSIEEHGTLAVDMPPGPPMFRFSDPEETRRVLEGAGIADLESREVALTMRLGAPDDLFDFFREGGVRAAALLNGQTPAARDAIRDAMRDKTAVYAGANGVELPMPCVLASAVKR